MAVLEGLEFYISKRAGRAIIDHKMIDDGDRIAVAVSGGKDSLTLLQILADRRKFVPIRYDLVAVHVDFGFHPRQTKYLIRRFKSMGIPYSIEKSDILKRTDPEKINCFWCAWNRRRELFCAADRLNCGKVAFGHHKDDIAQTMLMNLFFHGEISTMCPRQELFKGKIVVIRPLAYVEESMIRKFARQRKFLTVSCQCPHADVSKRRTVSRIIAGLAKICPEVTTNINKSTGRIKKDYLG
ncbi:MAG TPA: ATP-binding protein [Candidatus Omnitrophota bacterium]|nr:ATP-binding protein [Candidatus Omnitrophota bacterium]